MTFSFAPIIGLVLALAPDVPQPFAITVVDEQTGRGVPLVELRTVNDIVLVTDSQGVAAFLEPGLMDQTVYFHIKSHGYESPKDGFGYRGKALKIKPGGRAELKVHRINIAERLYRVTGGGIYRDSLLVGRDVPLSHPALNGQVLGSDSVVNAVYKGKIHWFWGDTNRPSYPLGNFHVPGATSRLPSEGGLDPERGIDLTYYLDPNGFAKPTCKMPGDGPTWIGGLTVLRNPDNGQERMFASYAKIRGFLEAYERGIVEWNDQDHQFEKVHTFPLDAPARPDGHPFPYTQDGVEYVYFAHPFPLTRVLATPEAFLDLSQYETFTCLEPGSRLDDLRVDRDGQGRVRYGWKRNTPAVGPGEQIRLIQAGKLKADEALLALHDVESGKPVTAHSGSVYWNPYRKRWIMISVQTGGSTSFLGEVWYAEADTPVGPWAYARKVVTHDKYTFYNPKQHPMLDKEGGRIIFFEGTYAETFSGNPVKTPRYDYNQVLYKLDLDDPRLRLPVAISDVSAHGIPNTFTASIHNGRNRPIAFFALDRPATGTIPVFAGTTSDGHPFLQVGDAPSGPDGPPASPVFHALPADVDSPPDRTLPLFEFRHDDGRRAYSINPEWSAAGFRRLEHPICRVWNRLSTTQPAS